MALAIPVPLDHRTGYDAELDLGVIAGTFAEAATYAAPISTNNRSYITDALNAQHLAGSFAFKRSASGPVLLPVRFSGKEFFTSGGSIRTSERWGGNMYGVGSISWLFSSLDPYVGSMTKITRVDGALQTGGNTSILRVRGNSQRIEGIAFSGKPWAYAVTPGEGPNSPTAQPPGTATPIGLEFEGQNFSTFDQTGPPSGLHQIRNCGIFSCDTAIFQRNGVYDNSGVYHDAGSGANGDNVTVENLVVVDVDTVFKSDNVQALLWDFDRLYVIFWGGSGFRPITVFDAIKCSNITCRVLSMNHPAVVLHQVTDNFAQRLICEHMRWDVGGAAQYMTLFKYADAAPVLSDMSPFQFNVRVSGELPNHTNYPYPLKRLIEVPQVNNEFGGRFPTRDLLFDLNNLPKDGFINVGGGWWKPGPNYTCDCRAHYNLDEGTGSTTADTWNGHTGTLSSSPAPSWTTTGYAGKCLTFSHNGAYVNVPDHSDLRIPAGTISFRVWVTSYLDGAVISKRSDDGDDPRGFRTTSGGNFYVANWFVGTRIDLGSLITTGSWHHVLAGYIGNFMTVYVDGVCVNPGGTDIGPGWFAPSHAFRFGAPEVSMYGASSSFDGKLDDVRFFGYILNQDEITDISNWRG
jgi:hypothetical protein